MSTIRMNIALGYKRGELQSLYAANPEAPQAEILEQWVKRRYGAWIDTHCGGDGYFITGIDSNSFRVKFENQADADKFLREIGGSKVHDE